MKFEREKRYIVLKIRDVDALPPGDRAKLWEVCDLVDFARQHRGKAPLKCVVVESDWRIYDSVWLQVEMEHKINNPELVATKSTDLFTYLRAHEHDIALDINDFGSLRSTFIDTFGHAPS